MNFRNLIICALGCLTASLSYSDEKPPEPAGSPSRQASTDVMVKRIEAKITDFLKDWDPVAYNKKPLSQFVWGEDQGLFQRELFVAAVNHQLDRIMLMWCLSNNSESRQLAAVLILCRPVDVTVLNEDAKKLDDYLKRFRDAESAERKSEINSARTCYLNISGAVNKLYNAPRQK